MNNLQQLTPFVPPIAQFVSLEISNLEPEILTPVLSSCAVRRGRGTLATLLRRKMLYPVFQPIALLEDGSIYAHEALIRGPEDSELHTPDKLLHAAEIESLTFEFENQCVLTAMARWGSLREAGRLFLNISADALIQVLEQCEFEGLIAMANNLGISPRMLVLEITEYERVADMDQLAMAVRQIRTSGVTLALDDFGDGRSSLRLWSQIKPEFVKIDKYFTKDISQYADKLKTIEALQQIAAIFGTSLIAEGIETEDDLRVLRDMGEEGGNGL